MTDVGSGGGEKDAWRQLRDLQERFTKEWRVRDDLHVAGYGLDRCVELALGERQDPKYGSGWSFTVTRRNVRTMREVATALIEACDFVDESNPEWAGGHDNVITVEIMRP